MDEGEEGECFKSFFNWYDKVADEQAKVEVEQPVKEESQVVKEVED